MRASSLPVLALALLVPATAAAQSFYLQSGRFLVDGADVGEAVSLPVRADAAQGTHARVRFDGAMIALDADVDLTTAHLQVGVGADTPLGGTFSPRMRRGTWAPVLAMAGTEVRVALPEGSPARSATLTRGAARANGAPTGSPWSMSDAEERDEEALHCSGFALSARPAAAATWTVPNGASRRRVRTANGVDTIEVAISGFVFTGYRPHDAACTLDPMTIGLANIGTGAGDGFGNGRVVVLPRGTQFFASATATHAFATLRATAYGIEMLDSMPGVGCRSGNECERVPPLPHGPARWVIELHERAGGQLLLQAWTHAPAERLADAPPNHGGFGISSSPDRSWPTLGATLTP